jgi:hypothetical protein
LADACRRGVDDAVREQGIVAFQKRLALDNVTAIDDQALSEYSSVQCADGHTGVCDCQRVGRTL